MPIVQYCTAFYTSLAIKIKDAWWDRQILYRMGQDVTKRTLVLSLISVKMVKISVGNFGYAKSFPSFVPDL
jgi:hypothetical protein